VRALDCLDILVNRRSGEFKIGLVVTLLLGTVCAVYFFVILYFLHCHNNELCALHSLIVWGPICKISYDSLPIVLRSTNVRRLIYQKSCAEREAFLRYDSLAES